MMKKNLIMWLLIVSALAVAVFVVQSSFQNRAELRRQSAYQAVLREYLSALSPGAQRAEVETVLASRGRSFHQMCCLLNENRNALEDIVKIGSGPKPWYCSENDTYLVFEFESPTDLGSPKAGANDRLRRIATASWLGGCL